MRPPSSRPPARPAQATLLLHFYWLRSGGRRGCSLIILACGIHTLRIQIDSSIKVFPCFFFVSFMKMPINGSSNYLAHVLRVNDIS